MIKITAIAPYPEFIEIFRKTFDELNNQPYRGEYEQGEYILEIKLAYGADEVKKLRLDSDVVVARGVTAYVLRKRDYYIPVVEIPVSESDLIHCLYECKKRFGQKEVAYIGSDSMIGGIDNLSEIVGLKVKPFFLADSDYDYVEDVVNSVVKHGINVVMAGIRATKYAESIGLDTMVIKSGKESMRRAISEAKRAAFISRKEQEKAQRFKTIIDYAYEGIIVVDKKNIINVLNSSSEKILGIKEQDALGKTFRDIMPHSRICSLLNNDNEYLDEIVTHSDTQLAVNKVPIVLKGENVGSILTFQNAVRIQEIEGKIREKIYTRGHIARYTFQDIIGESKSIKEAIETAKRFSQFDSNVLIAGKTGTGKEMFAQSIHNYSTRKGGPFVAVNCAALPESLLESELFGYVEGAFTGAIKGGKPGLFELAHKGTIFLDEISELSLKLQGRLLRVIQEKEIMRLGHDRVIPIDVRIISATNKDLYELVKNGDFREDLYYRLDVLKVDLPSLDERKEDIPIIFDYFIKKFALQFKREDIVVSKDAKKLLQEYSWPGNIRELGNICERLLALSQYNIIDEKDIKAVLIEKRNCDILEESKVSIKDDCSSDLLSKFKDFERKRIYSILEKVDSQLIESLKNIEKEKLQEMLKKEGYSKSRVAQRLGVSRTTLWRRMKELGMT